jgi:hypothetical protein
MATPAVAGAMALLWSAVPKLVRNVELTVEIFQRSAKHQTSNECSSSGSPNNLYGKIVLFIHFLGYGTIDVHRAYLLAKEMGY